MDATSSSPRVALSLVLTFGQKIGTPVSLIQDLALTFRANKIKQCNLVSKQCWMSYLLIGILFSEIEMVFAIFFDFIPETTEASFHTVQ